MAARALLAAALLTLATGAAAEFRSVAEPAVAYDAPSERGRKLYVVSRGYPVDVVITLEGWMKVRDPSGELAWLPAKAIAERRTVIVTAPAATVRERPEDDAPAVFQAANGVILEFAEPGAPGWIRVRHRDGQAGFVRISQVWGG
ncbi:MAG: SH3 domain-containing protein [Burkholderiales bacterium]|nr:SH3 domain-containing protein [Burkholderiales bacterium]